MAKNLFDSDASSYFSEDDDALAQAELDLIIIEDNEDFSTDENTVEVHNIQIFSRDWTVETVMSQIINGNIDLNPDFQRRNAWNDTKKSKLIESYLMNYPVPEIVLAEHPKKKGEFIVIDGKQRLLTLCGYIDPDGYQSWKSSKLSGLSELQVLVGKSFQDLKKEPALRKFVRMLGNSDVRCTVISNVKDDQVLYDIFYRLNSGATPLSVQELRQVLYSGPFTKFLIQYTDTISPIHHVLKLKEPDNRLKDIETLLRILAITTRPHEYSGNLKKFLDEYTDEMNIKWDSEQYNTQKSLELILEAIRSLKETFGKYDLIGRKYSTDKNKFDRRFNTVLFEVMVYSEIQLLKNGIEYDKERFIEEFKSLFDNPDFELSISASTKTLGWYETRYSIYADFINKITGYEVKHPWQ